jgi:hypothetical protein
MSWTWRYDATSPELTPQPSNGQTFDNQGDAETWLGENWRDLVGLGVESVTLLEGTTERYGPMSLRPVAEPSPE